VRDLPAAPVIPLDLGGAPYAVGRIELAGLPGMDKPEARAWAVLEQVLDPEVPALSVCDLGIVREVRLEAAVLSVWLTPTYSGCPATEAIECAVREALQLAGFSTVRTELRRSPAWTTDWISDDGRRKLREYGIAPPQAGAGAAVAEAPIRVVARGVACPRCGSAHTERLSAFGATACKALHRCLDCREPFEHFKPI